MNLLPCGTKCQCCNAILYHPTPAGCSDVNPIPPPTFTRSREVIEIRRSDGELLQRVEPYEGVMNALLDCRRYYKGPFTLHKFRVDETWTSIGQPTETVE